MQIGIIANVDERGNLQTSWRQHTPGWQSFIDGIRHVFAAGTEDGDFTYVPTVDIELWGGEIEVEGGRCGDFLHIDMINSVGVTPIDPDNPGGAKVPAGTAVYRFVNNAPLSTGTTKLIFPRPDRAVKLPSIFHLKITLEAKDATNANEVICRGMLHAFKHPSGGTWS